MASPLTRYLDAELAAKRAGVGPGPSHDAIALAQALYVALPHIDELAVHDGILYQNTDVECFTWITEMAKVIDQYNRERNASETDQPVTSQPSDNLS